jgi:hypothetical protein
VRSAMICAVISSSASSSPARASNAM